MIPGSHRATSLIAEFCGNAIGKRIVDLRIELANTSVRRILSTRIKSFHPFLGYEVDIVPGYLERAGFECYDDWGTLEVGVDTGRIVVMDRARASGERDTAEFEKAIRLDHALAGG
jgi:hypothetical protein